MKKFPSLFVASALVAGTAFAGGHGGENRCNLRPAGPIEALTPAMADGAEFAVAEVSSSGAFLGSKTVAPVRADSTCIDAAATAAAERLITSDGVSGIMGADCSGVTGAISVQTLHWQTAW